MPKTCTMVLMPTLLSIIRYGRYEIHNGGRRSKFEQGRMRLRDIL
jgi:hypothetical protein